MRITQTIKEIAKHGNFDRRIGNCKIRLNDQLGSEEWTGISQSLDRTSNISAIEKSHGFILKFFSEWE